MKFEKHFEDLKYQEEINIKYWLPSLSALDEIGIIYHLVEQKPGDIIYTGYGSYHWVLTPVSYFDSYLNIRMEPRILPGITSGPMIASNL